MKTCVLVICLAASLVGASAAGDIFIPYQPMSSINCNFFPFHVSFGEWRYQFVIGAKCLGGKSQILTHISFRPCQSNTFKAATFEMRMSHNTLTVAPSLTFAANMPSPQVVIPAGPITYIRTQSTWSTIQLTRSFTYNGKDNLTVELRYKGGSLTGGSTNGSDDSFPRDFSYQCYRVFNYGTGAYASTTASSQFNSGMLLTRLTYLDVNISGSGSPSIGGTVNLSLLALTDAGLPYQVGTSLGTGPILIGKHDIGLSLDQLLLVTVRGALPSIFQNYSGVLDTTGRGSARIVILNDPQLIGVRLHSAFLTIKSGLPFNVKSISNTFSFTITK
ncbi:MAG: hypothetical protein JXA57_18520 [Armatimonadetes bacterium]|nr:hypothetical protein [Armatimonadota bacterium]